MIINKARVFFMVNSFNEVVVIQTSHEEMGSIIKRTLNYKTYKNKNMYKVFRHTFDIMTIIKLSN